MSRVTLAGFNADRIFINDEATPETISAAYARISHSAADIADLRKEAVLDVAKARESNEKIVYKMGHSSIAEHAVFNIDITGISRLAAEEVHQIRVASYTEKSQRYVKSDGAFVVPEECEDKEQFKETMARLFTFYRELCDLGINKEDARYVLPLATETQFGMTINARSLENMIRNLSLSEYKEIRSLANDLYLCTQKLVPSLIKYTEPTEYEVKKKLKLIELVGENPSRYREANCPEVRLLEHSGFIGPNALAAAMYQYYDNTSFIDIPVPSNAGHILFDDKKPFDKVDKALEFIHFTFELVVSASCYAQLKRHRFTSQIAQQYSVDIAPYVPESIIKNPEAFGLFNRAMHMADQLYNEEGLEYALTNAHRRKVLLHLNGRELYHFISLREDIHAQKEIRDIAKEMHHLAAESDGYLFSALAPKKMS